jgi:hypothetical protein
MEEMKKWNDDNIDALVDLPKMSENWGEFKNGFKRFNQYLHKTKHSSQRGLYRCENCQRLGT